MKYPKLSQFLNRRQVEISAERGYIISQKQLAEECNTGQRSMGHWFAGGAMPEPWYWPALVKVFGEGFYDAIGQPQLKGRSVNPETQRLLEQLEQLVSINPDARWMLENLDDPNVKAVWNQAAQHAKVLRERKPDKNIRNFSGEQVTT